MLYRLLALIVPLQICTACLTMRNSRAIEEYRSPINEFDRRLMNGANYRILPGRLSSENGRSILQFDSLLIGEKRYLNIEATAAGMKFTETDVAIAAGHKVYVLQQNACCMHDEAFRKILFLKPGDKTSPAEILKAYYAFDAGVTRLPDALVVLDFTNIYTFSAMLGVWQNDSGVSFLVQAPSTDYNLALGEIEWQKRSRITLGAMYAWYVVAVPVDIITSPFQIAGLYLLGKGSVR